MWNFGRTFNKNKANNNKRGNIPIKYGVKPFYLAADGLLFMMENDESWMNLVNEVGGTVNDQWIRNFVCLTLESLAGESQHSKLIDLGQRFNVITTNRHAELVLPLVIRSQTEIGEDSTKNEAVLRNVRRDKDKAILWDGLLGCRRVVGELILAKIPGMAELHISNESGFDSALMGYQKIVGQLRQKRERELAAQALQV